MRELRGPLIVIALAMVMAMAAWGQGIGIGAGTDDLMRSEAGTAAPSVCLLANVGSKLLADTGSCLRAQ